MEGFPEGKEDAIEPQRLSSSGDSRRTAELPDGWLRRAPRHGKRRWMDPPPVLARKYDVIKSLWLIRKAAGDWHLLCTACDEYRNTRGQFRKIDDLLNVPEFNVPILRHPGIPLPGNTPRAHTCLPVLFPTRPRPETAPIVLATGAGLPRRG